MNTLPKNSDPILDDADAAMRETVAKLAAASPYMAPPSDLRGKILQATAPQTFRMEDYVKATRDTGRFFRWAFAAALLFLAAGAWYNITLRDSLKASNSQVAVQQKQLTERNIALSNLISPTADQISLMYNGKINAKAFVDEKSKTAVVVLPEGAAPTNASPVLTLTRNNNTVRYHTILVTAPRADFPEADPNFNAAISANNVQPDSTKPVFRATMGK